jgi:hypothetical protein
MATTVTAGSSPADLVIVGSGSLAYAVCTALSAPRGVALEDPVDVLVVARRAAKVRDLCYVATTAAHLTGRRATFRPAVLDPAGFDSEGNATIRQFEHVFVTARPRGVLVCASYQSPWERFNAPSAWTELLQQAGFGLSLPLQAALALTVARALASTQPEAWLVNACFPDAVNPLLAQSAVPVFSGVGNVALIAAGLQAALGLPDQRRLAVLGHHLHLHAPEQPGDEALGWLDGAPVPDVTGLLADLRATERPALNHITGTAAAALLLALLTGTELQTSLPGPLGLPGGYPVLVQAGTITLRLPDGLDPAAAVARNQQWADRDGVLVAGGRVAFAPSAAAALAREQTAQPELAELIAGFPVVEQATACRQLLNLRARLRARPAGGPSTAVGGHQP